MPPKKRGKESLARSTDASQIDVAQLAGVSQAAVSRVFTPGASVSEDIRTKVMVAVEQLGYRPNVIARSLVQNSTNIIGLVVKRFTNPFYAQMIQDFTRALQEKGYWTLVLNISENQELEDALPMVLQYQVDGLIITSSTLSSKLALECARSGTPVVMFNRYPIDGHTHVVCCDNSEGGKIVADAFLDAGLERIAFISGEEYASTTRDREAGFVNQLNKRGKALAFRESAGEYSYELGFSATQRLFANGQKPDAIFCANDLLAMAAMDFIRYNLNLRVPEDISIIGFDDIESAGWPNYQLTTIRQPFGELVNNTIQVLMDSIQTPGLEFEKKVIMPTLTWRTSCRSARS